MTQISEAIVLMAGAGSRLVAPATGALKPLTPILKRPLVSYVFDALSASGIEVIHAIVGYQSELLIQRVTQIVPDNMEIRFIQNPNWQKQNGLSVLAARGAVRSPFLLTMSDHLFGDQLLGVLLRNRKSFPLNLAIDRKIESIVDIDDAMKVQVKARRVIAIGKELSRYNGIDTGLFVADEQLFDYLEAAKRGDDCSLADGVRLMAAEGKVQAIDIGDCWWQDVDTPQTLAAAENHLRSRLTELV
jgi:choline kinase